MFGKTGNKGVISRHRDGHQRKLWSRSGSGAVVTGVMSTLAPAAERTRASCPGRARLTKIQARPTTRPGRQQRTAADRAGRGLHLISQSAQASSRTAGPHATTTTTTPPNGSGTANTSRGLR